MDLFTDVTISDGIRLVLIKITNVADGECVPVVNFLLNLISAEGCRSNRHTIIRGNVLNNIGKYVGGLRKKS